jgi:inosine-uridine nucleoside N-ribohydrolase
MDRKDSCPIWLDCDPGIDDAFAIILAAYSTQIKLVGISTSYGNTSLEKTTINALRTLNAIGFIKPIAKVPEIPTLFNNKLFGLEVPILPGSSKPLLRSAPPPADHVHGLSGLGDSLEDLVHMPTNAFNYVNRLSSSASSHFTKLWHDFLTNFEQKVTIVSIGPLTNLSQLLINYPNVVQYIDKVVISAGAIGPGNMTASAEFNILSDPEAASIVIGHGLLRTIMLPLEVTRSAIFTRERQNKMRSMSNGFSKFLEFKVAPCESFASIDLVTEEEVIDPIAVSYLIDPTIFESKLVRVDIETSRCLSLGRTIIDLFNVGQLEKNVHVVTSCKDHDKFWIYFFDAIEKANKASPLNNN